MESALKSPGRSSNTAPSKSGPRLRVVYREPDGALHLDWPAARIGEALQRHGGTVWVDVHDRDNDLTGVDEMFRNVFRFHTLAIEDALQETHVPKIDDWGDYLYTVFHSIDFNPDTDELLLHELDIFLGHNYLVTYHAEPQPLLDRLRQTIEQDQGARLARGPDHLLYQLLDLGVAEYMPAIDHLDEAIDDAQDEVLERPTRRTLQKILQVKRSAIRLHRTLMPEREVLNRLARDKFAQIDEEDRVYFRDVYDHIVRMLSVSETLRDLISGALDTYLSAISNRTNDVMKTLTIVTVLVLPLNLLAGFFGMNFFGDNILLHDVKLPHNLIFLLVCLCMVGSPWVVWLVGRRRGWF